MDQVKSNSQHIESLSDDHSIIKVQYVIKLTQLLVSVSLCSFVFSPSSLLALLHYFNFYFSTFPFLLFTHTIDKNCMFLLCNGLLVFVGITRSLSGSGTAGEDHDHEANSKYLDDEGSKSQFSDVEAMEGLLEKEAEERSGGEIDEQNISADQVIEIKYSDEVEEHIEEAVVEDEEEKIGRSQSGLEDEETGKLDAGDEGSEDDGFLIDENLEEEEIEEVEEEEELEEEENCLLSTEELNKKIDDFIRRMREDLRIEAQQQLIMV